MDRVFLIHLLFLNSDFSDIKLSVDVLILILFKKQFKDIKEKQKKMKILDLG